MLKNTVIKKLNHMTKEELLALINDLCESNEDVVAYLNNTHTSIKIDAEKYITRIEKCFEGCNFKVDKALNIYLTLRKTTRDLDALSKIGLSLLNELLLDYDLGNYSERKFNGIVKISKSVCEDMSKVLENEDFRKDYEALLTSGDENTYDAMMDIYYSYFDETLEEN